MYNGNILRSWILIFLIPLVQALSITVPSQAQANVPTRVTWSLDPSDPAQWDFRFVKDGKDVGLAAANVKAGTAQNGESVVVFPGVGNFVLAAVAGPDHNIIGQSLTAQVVNALSSSTGNPTSTSTSTSTSVSITTITPSATPIKAQSKPNVPAIVGGVLGTLIFLLLLLLLYLLLRRRNRNRSHIKGHAHPEMSATLTSNGKRKSWLQRLTSKTPNPPREVEGRGGPRAPKPSTPLPRTVIIRPPITARQQMIDNQIASLLEELTEIQREGELGRMRDSWRTSIVSAGTSLSTGAGALAFNTGGVISMGEVGVWKTEAERKERERERAGKVENVWKRIKALREMKNSEWALGDCDETPEMLRESGML